MTDKIIHSKFCNSCWFWKHLPDTVYNTVHEHMKQCGYGNIVKATSVVCEQYKPIEEKEEE